jgi:5'-nucleotidase
MKNAVRALAVSMGLCFVAAPVACDGGVDLGDLIDRLGQGHGNGHGHGHGGGDPCQGGEPADDGDGDGARAAARQRVSWRDESARCPAPVAVKLLGFNDFHGQLSTGRRVANRPVGGAAVMASYLRTARAGREDSTALVHAGDFVGASPAASALLQDEPSISFLNLLTNAPCKRDRWDPRCDVVGALGNHEFDEGKGELLRLLDGGDHARGPFLVSPWRGASYPTVCANVIDRATGKPLLPAYVIKKLGGVRVGFIGAVLKETPTVVTPTGVAGLDFIDEPTAINAAVAELRRKGVRAIVVTIHQGGAQTSYTGATSAMAAPVMGASILDIVRRLDDEVDVVVSGHSHAFTNALLPTAAGKPVLVTQAFSASTAYADIDLSLDPRTGDVIAKAASVVTTWGDEGPGLAPDAEVQALVAAAEAKVAPLVERVVGTAAATLDRNESPAGESALGNLIADAQRAATGSQLALMNPGGIRADIAAGPVTWGELFTVQPFGNSLVTLTLTGQDLYDVLNQQWAGAFPRILKTSGFTYTWSASRPPADRVVDIRLAGASIDRTARYTVTVNNFLAAGGDGFTALLKGTSPVGGDVDLDALISHVERLPQPFSMAIEGRIATVP